MTAFVVGAVFGIILLLVISLGSFLAREERWRDRWLRQHPPDDGDGCRLDPERWEDDPDGQYQR